MIKNRCSRTDWQFIGSFLKLFRFGQIFLFSKLSGEFATDLARSIGCPYAGKVLLRTDQGKEGQTVPSCSFASVELQFHR